VILIDAAVKADAERLDGLRWRRVLGTERGRGSPM